MRNLWRARTSFCSNSTAKKPQMPDAQRGDVWLVDLGLAAKVRPCLVLSVPVAEQDRALVTVVAHTTSPRGSRFEVAVTTRFLHPGVFDAQNLVTIPHGKLLRKVDVLSPTQLVAIEAAVVSTPDTGPPC